MVSPMISIGLMRGEARFEPLAPKFSSTKRKYFGRRLFQLLDNFIKYTVLIPSEERQKSMQLLVQSKAKVALTLRRYNKKSVISFGCAGLIQFIFDRRRQRQGCYIGLHLMFMRVADSEARAVPYDEQSATFRSPVFGYLL